MNPDQNQGQPQTTAPETPPAAPPATPAPATPDAPAAGAPAQPANGTPAAPAKKGGNKMLLMGAAGLIVVAILVYFLTK